MTHCGNSAHDGDSWKKQKHPFFSHAVIEMASWIELSELWSQCLEELQAWRFSQDENDC